MKPINVYVSKPTDVGLTVYKAKVEDYKDFYKLGGFDVVRVNWDGMDINMLMMRAC